MAREIGAVDAAGQNRVAQGAAATRGGAPSRSAAATRAAEGQAPEKPQKKDGARDNQPVERAELSEQARAELQADGTQQQDEARKAEELQEQQAQEDEKLQAVADQIEQKAKELEAEMAKPKEERNPERLRALTSDLHDLQTQFDNLTGVGARNPVGNAARSTGGAPAPVAGGGAPAAGGGAPFAGGGAPRGGGMPPLLGNPYGGMMNQGMRMPGGQQPAPPANPNVQIPDFGKNASKAEIGKMLDAASQKYGIPPNVLKAVAWQESKWNAKALSFDGQHGKGVMQIDDRFHQFARTPDVFDPAKNIDYGAKYLSDLYQKTGSWSAALKRYNGGSDYPPKVLALAQQQPWGSVA